jgi:hypothetical protein
MDDLTPRRDREYSVAGCMIWLEKEIGFVPHPASWLEGRRWEAETTDPRAPPAPPRKVYFDEVKDKIKLPSRSLEEIVGKKATLPVVKPAATVVHSIEEALAKWIEHRRAINKPLDQPSIEDLKAAIQRPPYSGDAHPPERFTPLAPTPCLDEVRRDLDRIRSEEARQFGAGCSA